MKKSNGIYKFIYNTAATFLAVLCFFAVSNNLTYDVYAAEPATSVNTDGNTANVVVFVSFADTVHSHYQSIWGNCFLEDPNIEELFNGTSGHPKALRQYIYNISYGTVQVANIFPQYDASTGKIVPLSLSQNASYYAGSLDTLIKDTVDALNVSGYLSAQINTDRDNDGFVDNLMVVVPCENSNSNINFYGLHSTYAGVSSINGKGVSEYNIVTESGAYLSNGQSGLLIHEYMHSLGYPDLYRYRTNVTENDNPISTWDIMSSQSTYLQYPLAYNRSTISNLFDIPVVTSSQSNYSIYSASVAVPYSSGTENSQISSDIKNNQAVILKTGYSDTEFFVIEYRKKADSTWVSDGINPMQQVETGYDYKIYGSGIIIYRVNLTTEYKSNLTEDPYYLYVFRPGDSYYASGIEKAGGEVSKSCLSAENGRTSYGCEDLSKGLSDGAITYSDGHNSGIVISNVGSTDGDTISFDITFPETSDQVLWETTATSDYNSDNYSTLSAAADDGTLYILPYDNNGGTLYTFSNNSLTKVSESSISGDFFGWKMATYENTPYVAFTDNDKAKLARWTGTSWQTLWTSPGTINGGSLCSDNTGIYLAYTDYNNTTVSCIKYNGSSVTNLGTVGTSNNYASSVDIAAYNGIPYVYYQEFITNKTHVKSPVGSSWNEAGNLNVTPGNASIKVDSDNVYVAMPYYSNGVTLYKYPRNGNSSWTIVGSGSVTNSSVASIDLLIKNGNPYVAVNNSTNTSIQVFALNDNAWEQVGNNLASENISQLQIHVINSKLCVCYQSGSLHKVVLKTYSSPSYDPDDPDDSQITPKITSTSLSLNGQIGLNLYATLPDTFDHAVLYSQKGGSKQIAKADSHYIDGSDNDYVFSYYVAAKEMNDTISLTVYDSANSIIPLQNEDAVNGAYNYSVMEYINKVIDPSNNYETSNPGLYSLCCDMKKYGENAQMYFKYDNEGLTLNTLPSPDSVSNAPISTGSLPSGIAYVGSSLLLKSATGIRHYFYIDNTAIANNTTFKIKNTQVQPTCVDNNNLYYIEISNIPAPSLGTPYVLKVTASDNSIEYTLSYSALSYVQRINADSSDEELKQLCNALYAFNNSAAAIWGTP